MTALPLALSLSSTFTKIGAVAAFAALVGIAIGAPSGALVGAVVPAHTTVYRAAPGKARQTTSPQTNARSQ